MRKILPLLVLFMYFPLPAVAEDVFEKRRYTMVDDQIIARGIVDPKVIEVMRRVSRHLFVSERMQKHAYEDRPLPIGFNQTISQPYIVAFMTEAVHLTGDERVLEIGTGSGYQAAVLAEMAKEVYTVEIVEGLAKQAEQRLKDLGYTNIVVKHGDGYKGFQEHAPYDVIVVTAAPQEVPNELISQLKIGGRMIIPIGSFFQELYLITRTPTSINKSNLLPVRFVPMIKGK